MTEHVIHDYIAGAIGGASGLVLGHPFDTTKVQLQTQHHGSRYKGLVDAVKNISHQSLNKGFFRGMSYPLFSYGITNSIFFGVYGNSLKWLDRHESNKKSSYLNIYLAGCIGGAAQLVALVPVDLVKVVLQSQIPHDTLGHKVDNARYFKGPTECAIHIYKTSGIFGFYRGLIPNAWRDIPSYGLYSLSYESLRQTMIQYGWTDSKGIIAELIAGGCAGTVTWFSIMPFDVIKSRYQADLKREYKGILDCVYKSYKQEGITVFYRGCLVTCLRAFPVNAVIFLLYSKTLNYLETNF
ncbi:SLC25A45_47 [Mytilus coruscus]|uniref:SLC25A45_47 n=1 Tax=Mytilus coruscus TaxID=42192 RepID=A0A6J8CMY3_MYTCO|nr:SLC25A45_47 [Mytilus coruscus]